MRAHCTSLGISIYGRHWRSPPKHPLWLCNYLFQVLNDLANNLLLLAHSRTLFQLFSGFVIILKVLRYIIAGDECCEGLFISGNKFVTLASESSLQVFNLIELNFRIFLSNSTIIKNENKAINKRIRVHGPKTRHRNI